MGAGIDVHEIALDLAEIRRLWTAAGRQGQPLICHFIQPAETLQMAEQISRGHELGIQTMQVFLEDRNRDEALPILDRLADAVAMATA
jgi:hypothetical protein